MVGPVERVFTRALPGFPTQRRPGTGLLTAGVIVFVAILASYADYKFTHTYAWTSDPVDLHVYRIGGLIVRHIRPDYNPHLAAPLYDWPGYSRFHLKFTYPPFAAVVFAVVSFIPWSLLLKLADVANVGLLVAALWSAYGGLGYRHSSRVRLGATLLTAEGCRLARQSLFSEPQIQRWRPVLWKRTFHALRTEMPATGLRGAADWERA